MDLGGIAARRGVPLGILVTRLRYLGDVILTTPVLGVLRECFPAARLYYLVEPQYAPVLRGHPDVDGIIEARRSPAGMLAAIRSLRKLRLTAAIDLLYNPRSALILRCSGIPVRIGGSRRRRHYTHVFSVARGARSAIDHHLQALEPLGCRCDRGVLPRVHLEHRELEAGIEALARLTGKPRRRVVAMHAGGTWPAKRWPAASFARLAQMARRSAGAVVILVTGPGEERITSSIAAQAGAAVHVFPPMPLREVAAMLAACDAVVANDGGIMHLAVALGRPTVAIFGPTEPGIWFPYAGKGPFAVVTRGEECAPCHLHRCDDMRCLATIPPGDVFEALCRISGW